MTRLNLFPICIILFLLSGCVTAPKPPQSVNTNDQQQALSQFTQWKLKGRLAFKSPEEKFSANLNWAQQQDAFQVNLTTLFGISMMKLTSRPGHAELEADDHHYVDTHATTLINRVTGWNIPVSKLPSWIKGQITTGDSITYNEAGLVKQLAPACNDCGAWQVQYGQYKKVGHLWLPHQIKLNNLRLKDNQIKIRIHSWSAE